jgi:ComF family protein
MLRSLAAGAAERCQGTLHWAAALPVVARNAVVDLTLPPLCAGCERDISLDDRLPLCQQCRAAFEMPSGDICLRCAAPAPAASIRPTGCVHCESTSFRFAHVVALGVYQGELERFVLRIKHQTGEALALAAGRLLARQIRDKRLSPPPQLVAAVPMHWWRRMMRGVNAAALVAESLSAELRLPLYLDLLRTVRWTPRQSSLTPSRRRRNMRNAFRVSRAFNIEDAHVLVVDDVLTTAGTANAVAMALRQAGAASVTMAVLARGIGWR